MYAPIDSLFFHAAFIKWQWYIEKPVLAFLFWADVFLMLKNYNYPAIPLQRWTLLMKNRFLGHVRYRWFFYSVLIFQQLLTGGVNRWQRALARQRQTISFRIGQCCAGTANFERDRLAKPQQANCHQFSPPVNINESLLDNAAAHPGQVPSHRSVDCFLESLSSGQMWLRPIH